MDGKRTGRVDLYHERDGRFDVHSDGDAAVAVAVVAVVAVASDMIYS